MSRDVILYNLKGEGKTTMRKNLKLLIFAFLAAFTLIGCTNDGENSATKNENNSGEKIKAVTSFTLLEDMVKEIGGDLVEAHNLVPTGTDPHEYDPLPDDIKAATDADILFYNGLNLEGGDHGWFAKLMDSVNQDWEVAFEVSEGVEPMYVTTDDGKEEEINPHAFLDPVVGIQMAENTRDAFIKIDPDNKDIYEKNADQYLAVLKEIDEEYTEKINDIPEENRILITSERAYQYMANRYGLKEGYVWAVDTEENGSPEQIRTLIEFINETNPPVLFIETNVDPRPLETVSKETGVEIFDEILSDEIGKPGEEGDTYVKFLKHNIEVIYEGLSQEN